jgi:thioredoxin-disulfide reductase
MHRSIDKKEQINKERKIFIITNTMEKVKTLIIGSGPAGYTAAIYASRSNLQPVLYAGLQPGGQLTTTTIIENFPGFKDGIDANELMQEMKAQATNVGADVRDGSIVKADLSKRPFILEDERGNVIEANTLIIATGASAKYLGLSDEEKYRGQGVSACATCDGFFYRKRTVAVVGGGDTACEEAMYLSSLAKKVYMIVRKPYLRAAEIMRKRVEEKENIEILYNTNTLGLYGEDGVEGAHLVRFKGEENEEKYDIQIDGFFLAIGHTPNTELFKGQLELDPQGFIVTKGTSTATNIEGVYAAGDVADPIYRQGVVAAGSGAKAAIEAERFLQDKGEK